MNKISDGVYQYKKFRIKKISERIAYLNADGKFKVSKSKFYAIYEMGNWIASATTLMEAKKIIDELED